MTANGQVEAWKGTGRAAPTARAEHVDYYVYLKSEEWHRRRVEARERAGGCCRVCGTHERLHTHHKTYRNLGAESQHELIVLCAEHHQGCHDFIANWKAKGWKAKSDYTLTMKYVAREKKKRQ